MQFTHYISAYHYHYPHTCSDGLVCDEPFCEVISVSLHMSVIKQNGDSALMMAAKEGRTEVVSLLLEAEANIHLQNKVKMKIVCGINRNLGIEGSIRISNSQFSNLIGQLWMAVVWLSVMFLLYCCEEWKSLFFVKLQYLRQCSS